MDIKLFRLFLFLYRSSILHASLIQVETPNFGKTNLFKINQTPKITSNQSKSLSINPLGISTFGYTNRSLVTSQKPNA